MTTLYGIKNCDTVKKAIKWLNANNVEFTFHDFKVEGLSEELLLSMVEMSAWDTLINKRSTTFRNLAADIKENLNDENAKKAILAQPTLIKRPVLIINNTLHVGFKPEVYQEILINE